MHRTILLALFPFLLTNTASAQCCCAGISIGVTLPGPLMDGDRWMYEVMPSTTGYPHSNAEPRGEDALMLNLRTGCGVDAFPWTIREHRSGNTMRIHLLRMGGDIPYPMIQVPFTAGEYAFDMRHMSRCMADQPPPGPDGSMRTIACNGGQLDISGTFGNERIQPLTLERFQWSAFMELPQPTASAAASFPGGEAHFQNHLRRHFDKALIERLKVRATLTGHAMIEENGTIHEVNLNGGIHPGLEAELRRVVQSSPRWSPTSVENVRHERQTKTFRYVRSPVPISFTVDPDSIWTEIPEASLSISPSEPTSRDSIRVTIKWMGGSCGQYWSDAEIVRQTPGETIHSVVLRFGLLSRILCDDRKPQSWTHVLPPLPPGRYRLKRDDFDDPGIQGWKPDPYAVREFEVR